VTYRGASIGCGFFAENHMNAWGASQGAEIAAVCDTDVAKARAFAKRFGAEAFGDAGAMLAEIKPDFVGVATTVKSHRALAAFAARLLCGDVARASCGTQRLNPPRLWRAGRMLNRRAPANLQHWRWRPRRRPRQACQQEYRQ
jgi:Oxidoreductase family, NAD-binding Rossmann fold